jgi:hypothetical protein
MNIETLRNNLQSVYLDTLGRNIDRKTLGFWVTCIQDGAKSMEEFKNMLLHSDEYKLKVMTLFRNTYMDLIGFDIPEHTTRLFVEHVAKYDSLLNDVGVRQFVIEQDEFKIKYEAIIESTFILTLKNNDVDRSDISFYLEKFKSNPTYSIEFLTQDIVECVHQCKIALPTSDNVNPTELDSYRYVQFAKQFEDLFGYMPDNISHWVESRIAAHSKCPPTALTAIDYGALESFEAVFKRPMFVQEYFKHNANNANHSLMLDTCYKEHHTNFNTTREIYESYTMDILGEYEYVKNYLNRVDDASFFINIVDEIVESQEYKTCMEGVITSKYKAMYDEDLDKSDICYIFTKVKEKKLSRIDDDLTHVINSIKSETDKIMLNIFKIFLIVYERQPDIYEIDRFVAFYRVKLPIELVEINMELERILMDNLEFHDIIKKRVRSIYTQQKSKDILPSIMFQILHSVTARIPSLTMATLDDFVRLAIQ